MAPSLEAAIKASPEQIPTWAEKICTREGYHQSVADPTNHITAVVSDQSETRWQTIHLKCGGEPIKTLAPLPHTSHTIASMVGIKLKLNLHSTL
ncbi:hypothetical protein PVAG01_10529 [Phlyctema vagabunda]|uniref:Uncharacterized protein n=1 Tax=Phlyctema vagabunda TaxID=108571 RepID=A0ABR4P2I6_9HELO